MDEDHRNFKRCGIRVQRHAVHRHHPYGSSLKHFQPSSESMRALEKIDIPWVILANKGSDSGGNWFQNDYIALSNSKQGFYRSRKNSNNQEENTDNDRYSVKNYVENSSATSRNSKLKIEVTNEIVEVSTKYDSQLNDTLYNNGENIKMTSVDLLKSTNPCSTTGCSTNIIKSVVNDDVTEASNETSKKLKGSEEIYFKNYEIPTNSQISIIENNKTSPDDINQFINGNFFNETFEGVANSTETVTNTIVNQFSEESLKHSLAQEDTLNNSFDTITTDEEQFNNTNGEYNDNETMKIIENSTKLQDETSVVEAVESEEKGNLEDNSELLKIFSSENTVAVENENTSKLISESEQKTNSESFIEVTNENYSNQELKSEKTINTQNTFELSNGSISKLMSEYEETTNVQQTQYKEEFELVKKTHLDGISELVTENSIEENTVAGEEEFSDIIFPEEEENISIPYSEYEKKAISGVSIELLNESSLTQEFGLQNENSSLLVSESKTNTNVQENAEPTNETHYRKEYELKEKTNLEGSSEIVTESLLEESTISGEDYFSETTTVEEKEENISKSDTEAKDKTISNISIEMTDKNSFSQESKSEETIHAENTFEFPNENSSEFVSESEETTNVQETAESTNKTHYTEKHELEEKTNLEGSSESMTESPLEESTTSGEHYFSEAMKVEEKEENISKSDSEAQDKTISNISIEMTSETSFSQESKSEETIHVENNFEFPNENSSEFVPESEYTTNVQETAESTNETHYKEEQELEENTNLEGSSEIMTESPLEESTTSGENYFFDATTVKEKEKNISKSDSEAKEKTISNISIEMINEISFSQESKSEETIHAENIFEFPNENSSEFVSESEETTNVQETAESTNKTHYTEKHELEENTNLEGISESMTENPLEENTTSGEDYFSEATTVKEKEKNISKSDSEAKEKTISNISIEMINEISFRQESKSEETIHAENIFEFPNENSSEFVFESEETTTVRETAESTNKTHYTEEHKLEENTNLEGSSESMTENPLEESTTSGEDYFSEATTVKNKEENISKSDSEAKEKTISNISIEMTNETSFSQESKSEETIHAENIFEFPNENFSEFVFESEETTTVRETAESTNKTHYTEEHELEENTNLEGSSESMTENPLEESTTSGEDYFSEATTVKNKEENISKSDSEAKEKTISNISIEMTNETSFSQESKSEETIHAENIFEFPNENSSEFVSESEETTTVRETAESTNKTHYTEEHELEEKTNLEGSSESVTQSPSEESSISGEDYFSEAMTVEEKEENISKSDSEAKGKTISNISTEITNSFSQESKSEETIKAGNIFELPNETSSEFVSTFAESTNETHYEEEVVKKTNLNDSSEIVTESSLEERAILGEKNFSETTAEVQSISKLESESENKTISEISVEMTNINSLSQESNSEDAANAEFTEISNEITSKLITESEEITSAEEIFESLNETNYEEGAGLEEKTNLDASVGLVTENPSNEMTISKEEIFYETTVDVENENVSKPVSESEGNRENSFEVSNEDSLNKELKSENTSNVEINIELQNANSSISESETKETTSVQQTPGMPNETYFEGETKLEIYTNLEGSSKLVTENSLKENTISEENIFSETTIKAQKESISKTFLSAEMTNSENFIEITKETSSNRESKSVETISTQNIFELSNENSSKLVSESEETAKMLENAALTNETHYEDELQLKEKTNLEDSIEFVTENSVKESTISEEDISSESIIKDLKESISKTSLSSEMTNFENFVEITKETSSNRESKSVETISTQNIFELSNENSSKLVSESEETAKMLENAALTNETHYEDELQLKEKTNLEDSIEFVTENSVKESTISEEDISSESIIKDLKESISKTSLSSEMTNFENFVEITKETSSNRESKSVETISTQNIFELSNENSSKLVSESEETAKMLENAALTNETHYEDELQLKEKTNLEDSSEVVTENSLKESTISEEDIFSAPTVEVEKEKLTKTNSESEIKTISEVSIEMTNMNSLSQESKSEELINAQITFELPNENYSKLMPDSEETTNVQKTAEFLNETNYEEEVDSEEKTNLESSSELMSESFLEERTISREEDIFETTVEAEKEYVTKPDSKFEAETNSEKFVEIANENSSIKESEPEEKINSHNSFKLQNANASKLEFESEETTNVQESAKLTVESTTNLEGSNKLTNISPVEEIKDEAENSNTSKEMSEFDEQSSSEVSIKVLSKSSSRQESESEETIYAQNTLELPNEDSSKLVSEAQETANVQETDEMANETHYNEELELRKKTIFLSSSELITEKYLKERTLSEEDFSEITVEAETKNISTEVSEIKQKTNIQSFVEVTNENSSGQLSESEVTVNSQSAFKLPIEESSGVFVSEGTTSIQETDEFTNEKNTNLGGSKLASKSTSEVEVENTETFKEMSQSEERSNSKSFIKVTNGNSSTHKPESEKSTKEQNTFEIANEDSLKMMSKPEKIANIQKTYELMNVTHYKPEFEEKTHFEDSNQFAYKSTFKEEPTSGRDAFTGATVEAENKSTSKGVFEYEEKTNSQIVTEIENENSLIQKSESEETTNEKNNIEIVNKNSSKMNEFEEITNLQETVKSSVELGNGTLHKGTSKPEEETDLKIISRVTNNNSYSVMPESKEANLTEMTFGNEQNILFSTSISPEKSISETTVTTVNEVVSVQMPKSEEETITESTFKQEHEKFYNGFPEIQVKREGLGDEKFYKNISESKKEEKLENNTQQMNENLYKGVSESIEESRINSKATMKYSTGNFYKVTSASKKDSDQENATELSNENITDKTTISEEKNTESVTSIVNENITKETNKTEEKTIWETIIESVTKMFSKQVSESEKINLMSTAEMSNEGYSKTAYEYEEKANQVSTENFYKDVSEFTKDIDVVGSENLTNKMYNHEVSEVKAETTKAYTDEINNVPTFEEVNEYKENINLQSTVGSAGKKSYTGVSAYEEKTNTEILEVAKEEFDKQISELLLDASPGIFAEVENEVYPKGTSEIEETVNPFNNSEKISVGEKSYTGVSAYEEKNNTETLDIAKEDSDKQISELFLDASPGISAKVENEDYPKGTSETEETINPFNNSVKVFEGYTKDLSNHTQIRNLERKIELTTGNFYKESIASKENISLQISVGSVGEKSYTGVSAYEEKTNTETLDIAKEDSDKQISELLLGASPGISAKVENKNYPKGTSEIEKTTNPFNNSEKISVGEKSYTGVSAYEEKNNTETLDIAKEDSNKEISELLLDASPGISAKVETEDYPKGTSEIKETINPFNNSEKISVGEKSSYEEKTNIETLDIVKEDSDKQISELLLDASPGISSKVENEDYPKGTSEIEKTINPFNNSEKVFEGYTKDLSNHTQIRNLEKKIELTTGNFYKETIASKESINLQSTVGSIGEKSYTGLSAYEEKTNIETLDIAKEDSDKQISELLLDASPGISAKVENEDYSKGTSEIEETINPFNNSVMAFEGYTKDLSNHTQIRNLERKIELTTGNFYKENIASKENISLQSTFGSVGEKSYTGVSAYEEKNNTETLDIAKEDSDKQISELLLDASPGISAKVENEDYLKGTSEIEKTINPFNNSEKVFEGYTKDLSNHTQIGNLERKIELTTGNFYKESIASKEEANPITSSDLINEDIKRGVLEVSVGASIEPAGEMANESIFTNKFETDETINPLNNSEAPFKIDPKYLSNDTEVSNLDSKIELTTGNSFNGSTESEEETNTMTYSDLMHEITKTEVPKILVDASMKTSREMANENISTDKFESEKTPNLINNSEVVFEDYSKNVFGHTKSTNVESNTELRKGSSYKKITGSVQETNPNKSISNGITSHVMIENEIWDKTYGTTTEEEIRLSNTDIKFYDGRENIHPGYTNEKEFHKSHTEISEYSTNNKKDIDIQIATSSSNKTSKTVSEFNKKSNGSEILTKAPTHVTRAEIALEGSEENVTIIDLGNLTNNSSKEIHESSDSNINITTDKLLTEVSSENVLSVSDSFDFTTKYPNHFSNTESQIYKSNDVTTAQDFVVNGNFSPYKETSKYLEDSDNSESITEDQIQFSNAEINFQQSEANFNLQDGASNEGVELQMNSSASYVSFSETSTNEIFTNVSNENTRRTIEEYDTLDEEVADITTKHKKKFSNDEINFHENEEKMTEGIFFETFITDVNETSTEAGEVLSKYFDISTENKIQITNPDIHLHKNVQNISIHKVLELQDVKNEDRTESNNKNVSLQTSDNDFYEISDDFSKDDKTENENFVATTKSQFLFNNTETDFFHSKEIASKDTDFYISELNSKITTEFGNINSFKNMSGDSKNVPENVTFPISIDDSAGRFSHVIDGNKNSNNNFVITTEKQFRFNRTETELYENEESISPREVDEFENSSANVEISNYETDNVKIIKNSSADVDDDKYNTQKEAEAQFLNSSEDIDKGTLVKTKYTMDSLKHDFTSKYNTYSTFIEKKYSKYPNETIQQFMMKTTAVPPKLDHTDHLNAYKHDILKMSTYHKDNTKLQPLENINKYYNYDGQSFNSIRQAARNEYHKAYFLSKMFENQPAFSKMFQHSMFYQNPNFMNERPINFPEPYYESKLLQSYAQSYPYLYDQFHVNYPVSRFYQAGLYQQPLFSHNMVNPLPNNYRPYYGSENYQPSVQSYPSMYNKRDLGNMYPSKPVDFSTFHQKGFYRQPNPMYMIANPSLRRYRRSYGTESLQRTVQPNPSILKEYSLKKIEENQSTDLPKHHQVGLTQQLNPIYGITESLLNKDNIYFLADSHPFFVKTHLNVLEPFEGKGQLDEFSNKEGGIIQGKPEISHFGTKNNPPRKQNIKKRKRYTKSKLRNGNRSLNSVVKKRGTELPAFTGNGKKSFNHKKYTFDTGRTEEPFRQAYRESIDRYNLLHVIEYLPPEKTYRKRIFNNETLDVTESKSIKHQTAHYSIWDKILSTSTDYYKVPAGEKYFTNEYTVRKNEKYSKGKSEGDKLIEKSKIKGKRQKEELKPIKRNLNRVLISEMQNTSQGFKNSNSYQENTLNNYLDENVTLFNDLDAVLNDVEFFPVRSEVQKTNVRRSNFPGISRKEANLQEGRTIGGKLEYENWPWIVSIYKLPDMFHVCSGTLIDDRHILTAAHCFLGHDYEEYVASVGSLMKISDPNQGYLVEDKIIHTGFKKDCYCNDIALLRLKYPVDKHLTPICLSAIDTALVGENTTLLGWGDMKFMAGRGKSGTDRLQRLNNLPITSSEECRKVYSRILDRDLSKNFSESYVCAGVPDGSKDACVGDSGGPLLHRSYDGSWTLLGVVSFGYKCGAPGVPGIYTRVSYYLQWIYGAIDKFDLSHLHDKPHSN